MNARAKPPAASTDPTASAVATRTGPGRPTKKQIEERNVELLDKALDIFLENGFERTTIREITETVGMAKRTVTSRYGNKVSLLKAALHRAIDEWALPIEPLREAETDDREETLFRIARILVHHNLSPAGLRLLRISNAESYRMPEIGAYALEQGTRSAMSYLSDLFERRFSEGRPFPDAEKFAFSFLGLVVGSPARMVVWGIAMTDAEIEAHIVHSVRLFLHGMMHRPSDGA